MDWYTSHLYKVYEAKFHEKFFRKSPYPQWIGWYNKYNQAFSYEIYDPSLGVYVKRMMPQKIPNVIEFSFIDNQDFLNTGLCIYRQEDKICWFSLQFGTDMSNRDDEFWTQPQEYGVKGLYYLYVHDVKFPWNGGKIVYIFAESGTVKVFAIDTSNPSVLHKVDMSSVTTCPFNYPMVYWVGDISTSQDPDIRLSKTSIELSGIHKCFQISTGDSVPSLSNTRIFSLDVTYSEDNDDLMFKSNIPGIIWWRNRPSTGSYPPLDGEDDKDYALPTIPYKYIGVWAVGISYKTDDIIYYSGLCYKCISDHTSSLLNIPTVIGAPWAQFEWFTTPPGTAGYSYAVGTIPTGTLEYEWINWRSDADREWFLGSNQIIVRTGGGFAYILLA